MFIDPFDYISTHFTHVKFIAILAADFEKPAIDTKFMFLKLFFTICFIAFVVRIVVLCLSNLSFFKN